MGCASSIIATAPASTPRLFDGVDSSFSSVDSDRHFHHEHYTLAVLRGRRVFGPYINFHSYDPESGSYKLTVLVVAHQDANSLTVSQGQQNQKQAGHQKLAAEQGQLEQQSQPPQPSPQLPQQQRESFRGVPPTLTWWEQPWQNTESTNAAPTTTNTPPAPAMATTGPCETPVVYDPDRFVPITSVRDDDATTGAPASPPIAPEPPLPYSAATAATAATAASAATSMPLHTTRGDLLYTWCQWHFWRFPIHTTCVAGVPKRLSYTISGLAPAKWCSKRIVSEGVTSEQQPYGAVPGLGSTSQKYDVAVPAADERWRLAFYSCNGLHEYGCFDRPHSALNALWRDMAARHGSQPFHVLLGAGDQLYNDGVFEGPLLKGWDRAADESQAAAKARVPFSTPMQSEVEEYYMAHYLAHWAQPGCGWALATIPAVNTWDDHDIVDGWGSYPDLITNAAVMRGLFDAARLFYLLFQHHTTPERLTADGYWCVPASCRLLFLGCSTAMLLPDTRTCRTMHRVLPPDFIAAARQRLAVLPASVRHLLVVVGSPILYPNLPVQEALEALNNLVTGGNLMSVIMQKTGLAAAVTKRFGMVDLLDDVIDQWSASQHVQERDELLRELMDLAATRRFRVTILSGDVHCAGYGMYHSCRRSGSVSSDEDSSRGSSCMGSGSLALPSESELAADPRFIPQVISSAIVNVPPPASLLGVLCLAGRSPQLTLGGKCIQRMVPLFGPEGDVTSILHGRRNWCEVTLGDASGQRDHLTFSWRCEKELGSQEVNVFSTKVLPLVD